MRTLLSEIIEGDDLTVRELEVLHWTAEGLTSSEIAEKIFLSEETVKGYRKRMIAKLGAKNGTHAVATAMRRGLIA